MSGDLAGSLAATIAERIRREGPLSVAAFMAMALHDPTHGYYNRREPFGAAGDFITASGISQIFGELIGLWCADFWDRIGRPDPVNLVELGPGDGTLMSDFLRAARSMPAFRRALRLYLVESSPALRAKQQRRLEAAAPRFAATLDEVPDGPLLLVANEFLDALPIRQLVRLDEGWGERRVALGRTGGLTFAPGPASQALALLVPERMRDSPTGAIVEICPSATALGAALGDRLTLHNGAALLVDYGYCTPLLRSTLAAVRHHRPAGILDDAGQIDLSAHVDFARFAAAVRGAGAVVHGPLRQGRFLQALGAAVRLAALTARAAAPAQREALTSGLQRLIDPAQMGNLFKVLALTSPGLPAPAGFE